MKSFLNLYLLLFLIKSELIKSSIVEIEELYNPEINQTIILMGDTHLHCENNVKQIKIIIEKAKEYKAYNIIESNNDALGMQNLKLIHTLYNELIQNKLPVNGIEFRALDTWFIMLESLGKYKNFQQVYDYWHTPEIKSQMFNDVFFGFSKRLTLKDDLELYVKNSSSNDPYIDFIEKITEKSHDTIVLILKDLKKNGKYEIDDTVNYIFENTFIKKPNGEFELNPENILDKLFYTDAELLNALAVKNIHQQKNQRVLFIVLGQTHTERISQFLQNYGFLLKNKQSSCKECDNVLAQLLAQRKEYQEGLPRSPKLEKYCLDLNNFFNQNKTLPGPSTFYSKLIYIPKLLLSWLNNIYFWFHNTK